jgi:glucose/arabinose dehydrogenase
MNTITSTYRRLLPASCAFLIAIAALWVVPRNAWAQLYVTHPVSPPGFLGVVSEYDAKTGAAINAKLIGGLSFPDALALKDNTLFVANGGGNTVGEYDATTGAPINASFITGLKQPAGLALLGNTLFVANSRAGTVGKYDAATTMGVAINASFITGLNGPAGLAVKRHGDEREHDEGDAKRDHDTLFVANSGAGTVGKYDATTGAPINASFITGLNDPVGLALRGDKLFVANSGAGTVGEYDAKTGGAINVSFITGLNGPAGLALLGDKLFVANSGANTVGKYDAKTGAPINANFIPGFAPAGIAVKRHGDEREHDDED